MTTKRLSIFAFILVYLVTLELAVEYRSKERGFSTYLLGKKNTNPVVQVNNKNLFPFRSPAVDNLKKNNYVRIWMASASYAEDTKRQINELFPNILCEKINTAKQPCQMLNAAKAGYTISDNIKQLKSNVKKWNPDYALLYSMNLDINNLSSQYLSLNKTKETNKESENVNKLHTTALSVDERIEKTVEQMTIYGHLRRYIGGHVLMSSLLHNEIGYKANNRFKITLQNFIKTCKELGVKPILVTFATKYNISNFKKMKYDEKLFLTRYNEYLSPKGWVKTIRDFNNIIRQTANENSIPYIDLAKNLGGQSEYFTDFVHFTKNGHKIVGQRLADEIIHIVNKNHGHKS